MLASVPRNAGADTIYVTDNLTYPFGTNATGGGPYVATTSGSLLGSRTFVTFGLEYNEPVAFDVNYEFVLSDNAFHGGVNGAVGDPVQNKTKWLYYQIASGAYATWGSGSPATNTDTFGSSVQQAIWYFEGERRQNQIDEGAQAVVDYVTGRFSEWTLLEAQGHHVLALNLTAPQGCVGASCEQIRDQLAYAYIPAPEPASMILFGSVSISKL